MECEFAAVGGPIEGKALRPAPTEAPTRRSSGGRLKCKGGYRSMARDPPQSRVTKTIALRCDPPFPRAAPRQSSSTPDAPRQTQSPPKAPEQISAPPSADAEFPNRHRAIRPRRTKEYPYQ